jgi:hypothetical protein
VWRKTNTAHLPRPEAGLNHSRFGVEERSVMKMLGPALSAGIAGADLAGVGPTLGQAVALGALLIGLEAVRQFGSVAQVLAAREDLFDWLDQRRHARRRCRAYRRRRRRDRDAIRHHVCEHQDRAGCLLGVRSPRNGRPSSRKEAPRGPGHARPAQWGNDSPSRRRRRHRG